MPVIHFQMGENSICLTKCPHADTNKSFKPRVGSQYCLKCLNNVNTDYDNLQVVCNKEFNHESNQSVTK